MALKNLSEGEVAREYERLKPTIKDFCGCVVCRDDVMVFALNRVRAHYVAQHRGAVLQHLAMQKEQIVADVAVAVLNGFKLVAGAPRPNHLKLAAERQAG
ncbi:MAG: late competence development ComFB family protein [Gemmatimonadales bacterium]